MDSSNIESRRVQSSITSVSFPQTLESLRAMGKKWVNWIGQDWITDMDVLLDFPSESNVAWIAPKWLTAGDILFFYHTKRARLLTADLYNQARRLRHTVSKDTALTTHELMKLIIVLERAVKAAQLYSGTILGFAEVSGRPQRIFDEYKHFKGTIYAPLRRVYIFEYPLKAEDFADIVRIGQNTTTPIYGSQFDALKQKIALKNKLPKILEDAKSGGLGLRDVRKDNWDEIVCTKDLRFINEAQLRYYFVDYLLNDIKDAKSSTYTECTCYKDNQRTGIVDYFIRLGNKWFPVEAKLNLLTEQDIFSQIDKYTHIDYFISDKGEQIGGDILPSCLIVDQEGLYLVSDGKFLACNSNSPLFKRNDLSRRDLPRIRNSILNLLA